MAGRHESDYRAMTQAFNDRDVEHFLTFCHPDMEYHALMAGMGGVYHGHGGMRMWFADLAETLRPTLDILGVEESGDALLGIGHARGVGVGSGLDLEWDFFQAVRYRDGLAVWAITTSEEQPAREAVAL